MPCVGSNPTHSTNVIWFIVGVYGVWGRYWLATIGCDPIIRCSNFAGSIPVIHPNILYKSKTDRKDYNISLRKVERPPYHILIEEIEKTNCLTVSKKYGVSDNTIRKWIKHYKK